MTEMGSGPDKRPAAAAVNTIVTRQRALAAEAGFTLVEVMVAVIILLAGVLGVLTLLDTANGATHRTKVRDGATSLAREAIEAARAWPYPNLQSGTVVDQAPGTARPGGRSRRQRLERGIVAGLDYTITASVCSVDGGTDGYGGHGGSSYCPDSTSTGTADSNPVDYKRVDVVVSWDDGKELHVHQEAVINDPGSAFAPSVTAMQASATSVTQASVSQIVFSPVTTSMNAQSVRWYVDNVQLGNATGSNKTWQFTWNLNGVCDGTYQIRAQAYDGSGQTAGGYVVTVVLNREVARSAKWCRRRSQSALEQPR